MTDREKLTEVIYSMDLCSWDWAGKIADHLIANGVEIPVRCKDCSCGMYAGLGKVACEVYPIVEKANFYCALGERKDNG